MPPTDTLTANGTLECFRAVAAALSALPTDVDAYRCLSESELLEINSIHADSQLKLGTPGALIAGEVDHRSAPELGSEGLAQKTGHRTPELFIKHTTGATGRGAITAVRVGKLMREAAVAGEVDALTGEIAVVTQPWLAPVSDALASRTLSIEKAEAIRAGLREPNSAITAEQLQDAAIQLVELASRYDPDALATEARIFRDELDLDGVALRAEERRQKRSLKLYLQPDGTTKLVWVMDTETAAIVRDLYDRATSPKLGGIRFVDPTREALSESIRDDDRAPDQLASDAFEQLLKLGADANPNFLLGSGAPVVKITATSSAVKTGRGLARVEGQPAPLGMPDLERLSCGGYVDLVTFDENGFILHFGREQRLFSKYQKEALALIWGGCAIDGCERPPSWTEVHHIFEWAKHKGKTDLADGILLCKHHHLLLHNRRWNIFRDNEGRYWLEKPPGDPNAGIIELRKNGLPLRDLQREAFGAASVAALRQGQGLGYGGRARVTA
jgi:Domain of unknown function (DUF222)